MPSIYGADEQEAASIAASTNVNAADVDSAAALLAVIADDADELMVGSFTFGAATKVIANTLSGVPDFNFCFVNSNTAGSRHAAVTATTTSITFTTATAATAVAYYILGYTA